MSSRTRNGWLSLALIGALLQVAAPSYAGDTPIPSTWQVQEINYSYVGFTTAYDCDSAAAKIKSILKELGAHPSTKVRASGCESNRPARNFFVTVTAATPVPTADVKPTTAADQSKQELLTRLGVKSDFSATEFPAQWKTVDLAKNKRLDLRPGDCELMEGLQDRVLPKLGMKITDNRISCTPNRLGITTPQMTVSALVPVKSPDEKPTG
jgi:hypothetical protein